jgi:hypothetical protein
MTSPFSYRGFLISLTDPRPEHPAWRRMAWQWVADDYDGPWDDRLGYAPTALDCIAAVDACLAERTALLGPDSDDSDDEQASYFGRQLQ